MWTNVLRFICGGIVQKVAVIGGKIYNFILNKLPIILYFSFIKEQ